MVHEFAGAQLYPAPFTVNKIIIILMVFTLMTVMIDNDHYYSITLINITVITHQNYYGHQICIGKNMTQMQGHPKLEGWYMIKCQIFPSHAAHNDNCHTCVQIITLNAAVNK